MYSNAATVFADERISVFFSIRECVMLSKKGESFISLQKEFSLLFVIFLACKKPVKSMRSTRLNSIRGVFQCQRLIDSLDLTLFESIESIWSFQSSHLERNRGQKKKIFRVDILRESTEPSLVERFSRFYFRRSFTADASTCRIESPCFYRKVQDDH